MLLFYLMPLSTEYSVAFAHHTEIALKGPMNTKLFSDLCINHVEIGWISLDGFHCMCVSLIVFFFFFFFWQMALFMHKSRTGTVAVISMGLLTAKKTYFFHIILSSRACHKALTHWTISLVYSLIEKFWAT